MSTKDTSDHGTRNDPNGTFELCLSKTIFFPKINWDRVAYNVFDLQNNFYEDRLSLPVLGENINFVHSRPL